MQRQYIFNKSKGTLIGPGYQLSLIKNPKGNKVELKTPDGKMSCLSMDQAFIHWGTELNNSPNMEAMLRWGANPFALQKEDTFFSTKDYELSLYKDKDKTFYVVYKVFANANSAPALLEINEAMKTWGTQPDHFANTLVMAIWGANLQACYKTPIEDGVSEISKLSFNYKKGLKHSMFALPVLTEQNEEISSEEDENDDAQVSKIAFDSRG